MTTTNMDTDVHPDQLNKDQADVLRTMAENGSGSLPITADAVGKACGKRKRAAKWSKEILKSLDSRGLVTGGFGYWKLTAEGLRIANTLRITEDA